MDNSYICVKPTKTVAAELEFISKTIGYVDRIPVGELHCTLISAETGEHIESLGDILTPDVFYNAKPAGLTILGEGEKRAVVLLLDSPELQERHKELGVLLNHSFSEFKPHISLKYAATDGDERLTRAYTNIIDLTLASVVLTSEQTHVGEMDV